MDKRRQGNRPRRGGLVGGAGTQPVLGASPPARPASEDTSFHKRLKEETKKFAVKSWARLLFEKSGGTLLKLGF